LAPGKEAEIDSGGEPGWADLSLEWQDNPGVEPCVGSSIQAETQAAARVIGMVFLDSREAAAEQIPHPARIRSTGFGMGSREGWEVCKTKSVFFGAPKTKKSQAIGIFRKML
jgi:hypothetical protein